MDPTATKPPRRGCLTWAIRIVVLLILIGAGVLYLLDYLAWGPERALTTRLPDADRIEVQTLKVHGESITAVVATREVTGPQAADLMSLWHHQSYRYGMYVMCHQPAYRLWFFSKDELLTEATICFQCQNIYFYKIRGAPKNDMREVDFVHGSILQAFLENLFPDPKDKSVYDGR